MFKSKRLQFIKLSQCVFIIHVVLIPQISIQVPLMNEARNQLSPTAFRFAGPPQTPCWFLSIPICKLSSPPEVYLYSIMFC